MTEMSSLPQFCAFFTLETVRPGRSRETIPAMRKTKTALKECDIKPLIYDLKGEGNHLYATLVLTEREACKPGMLTEAMCREAGITDEVRVLICREALLGENEQGMLVPLEIL